MLDTMNCEKRGGDVYALIGSGREAFVQKGTPTFIEADSMSR